MNRYKQYQVQLEQTKQKLEGVSWKYKDGQGSIRWDIHTYTRFDNNTKQLTWGVELETHQRGDIAKRVCMSENLGIQFPLAATEKDAMKEAHRTLQQKSMKEKWDKSMKANNGRLLDTTYFHGKSTVKRPVKKDKPVILPGGQGPMEDLF